MEESSLQMCALKRAARDETVETYAGTLVARGKCEFPKRRTAGVGAKGKNRKENGKNTDPAEPRPEHEQAKDEGMSDDIVRDFLVESSAEPQPTGEQPDRSGHGHGGYEFCPGPDRQSGHPERHRKGPEPAQPAQLH